MRVGFFGGTFDPPHRGHAAVARAAAEQFGLDTVLWAPAGRQPLKRGREMAGYADRLAMVELACVAANGEMDGAVTARAGACRFEASTLDQPAADGAANYTVDTLRRLRTERPHDVLFCLAGADSFADLARWREPYELLALAEWIVVSRPGFALAAPDGLRLDEVQRQRIHLLDAVHEGVSATGLRERLRAGEPCQDVLAPAVADYVEQHGLYRPV